MTRKSAKKKNVSRVVKTKAGFFKILPDGNRYPVVRIPKKFARSRATGKLYAVKWQYQAKESWALRHGLVHGDSGKWEKPVTQFNRAKRTSTGAKVAKRVNPALDNKPSIRVRTYKDGSKSYAFSDPLNISWDSPDHTEDNIAEIAEDNLARKAKSLSGQSPTHYRGGFYFFRSARQRPDGSPIWEKFLYGSSESYYADIDGAMRSIRGSLGVLLQQKVGSQGSGRIWVKSLFVEIKVRG